MITNLSMKIQCKNKLIKHLFGKIQHKTMSFISFANCQNHCFISATIVNQAINYLVQKTFQGVAQNNVVKMIPKSTNKENIYTLKSFISMAHTQNNTQYPFQDQKDPLSPPLDNFSVHQIVIEQPNLYLTHKINNQTKSIKTQKSVRSRKFTNSVQQNQISKSKMLNNLEQLPQQIKQQTFDPAEQKLRANYLNFQKQQKNNRQILLKSQAEKQEKKKINSKIIKDIKKFTYDYQGKIHGQGNGSTQMEKLLLLKQKFLDLKTIKPNYSTIKNQIVQVQKPKKNQKLKERLSSQPFFSDQPKSIVSYLNEKSIALGVKITQMGNNNQKIVKENPNTSTELKNFKIGQYKSLSQNLKFKEHPRAGSLYQTGSRSILDRSLKEQLPYKRSAFDIRLNNQQRQNRKKNSKSHFSYNSEQKNQTLDVQRSGKSINLNSQNQFKTKVKYSGLPFIKTKGYRAIDIASQRSFKIEGELSRISGIKSKKSKIQIDNCELFSDNFALQIQN